MSTPKEEINLSGLDSNEGVLFTERTKEFLNSVTPPMNTCEHKTKHTELGKGYFVASNDAVGGLDVVAPGRIIHRPNNVITVNPSDITKFCADCGLLLKTVEVKQPGPQPLETDQKVVS